MNEEPNRMQFPREFPGVHYYGRDEEEAAVRVIRQRSPFRYYGANLLAEADSLEREFAAQLNRRYGQAVSSGTNGLLAALAALGIGPGQEVLMPGFSWVSTVGTVVRSGAIPVLVEIDDTFTLDPADLERKITRHSGLILPVHMCGAPCDMAAIMDIAGKHGLPVLEDCAQANGATFKGRRVGTFGQIGMFSFQMNKSITAGEGGMLVTDDELLAQKINAAHDVGVPWKEGMPDQSSELAMWGAGARMGELAAAVIRAQLPKLDTIAANMRATKYRILDALSELKSLQWARVVDPAGDSGSFIVASCQDAELAKHFAAAVRSRGLTCWWLPEYGLHVYYNIKALVEKRSNAADGFPWTHPANEPLQRDYRKGSLPATDDRLEHSFACSVPSLMAPDQEQAYIEIFKEAYTEAGLG